MPVVQVGHPRVDGGWDSGWLIARCCVGPGLPWCIGFRPTGRWSRARESAVRAALGAAWRQSTRPRAPTREWCAPCRSATRVQYVGNATVNRPPSSSYRTRERQEVPRRLDRVHRPEAFPEMSRAGGGRGARSQVGTERVVDRARDAPREAAHGLTLRLPVLQPSPDVGLRPHAVAQAHDHEHGRRPVRLPIARRIQPIARCAAGGRRGRRRSAEPQRGDGRRRPRTAGARCSRPPRCGGSPYAASRARAARGARGGQQNPRIERRRQRCRVFRQLHHVLSGRPLLIEVRQHRIR